VHRFPLIAAHFVAVIQVLCDAIGDFLFEKANAGNGVGGIVKNWSGINLRFYVIARSVLCDEAISFSHVTASEAKQSLFASGIASAEEHRLAMTTKQTFLRTSLSTLD